MLRPTDEVWSQTQNEITLIYLSQLSVVAHWRLLISRFVFYPEIAPVYRWCADPWDARFIPIHRRRHSLTDRWEFARQERILSKRLRMTQTEILTPKRLSKMPNLSYLTFKNASWQPWSRVTQLNDRTKIPITLSNNGVGCLLFNIGSISNR